MQTSGGAIFAVDSQIHIIVDGRVEFSHNVVTSANGKDAAIYIEDSNCEHLLNFDDHHCIPLTPSIIQLHSYSLTILQHWVQFYTVAHWTDAITNGRIYILGMLHFNQISQFTKVPHAVSSDPVRICFCLDNFQPNCTLRVKRGNKNERRNHRHCSWPRWKSSSVCHPSKLQNTTAKLGKGEARRQLAPSC